MDTAGAAVMAKKKAKPTSERKPMIAQLRGSEEFKLWIERAAKRDNRSVASFLERGAIVLAKQIGFEEEAPER